MEEVQRKGRKPIYLSEQERIDARKRSQMNYYNRIKENRKDIIKLNSLRRYYKRILSKENADSPKYNKHINRLNEIERVLDSLKHNDLSS